MSSSITPRDARRRTASSAFGVALVLDAVAGALDDDQLAAAARARRSPAPTPAGSRGPCRRRAGRSGRPAARAGPCAVGHVDGRPVQALERDPVAGRGLAVVRVEVLLAEPAAPPRRAPARGPRSGADGVAPRRGRVGAQRAGVQALAEPLARCSRPSPARRRPAAPSAGRRCRPRPARSRSPRRSPRGAPTESSVSRSSISGPLRCSRTTSARSLVACSPRTRRVALHRDLGEQADVLDRDDGVEHQAAHAVRVGERVALRGVGPVGGAVERELVDLQRDPQRLEVRDRVGGAEEAPLGARSRARSP